jgi:hypothetical protein
MTGAYADIARILQRARRRQAGVILLSAASTGLGSALLCLLLGAAGFLAGARSPLRWVALAGAGIGLVMAGVRAVRGLLRSAWSDHAAARTVGAREPAFRSALLSAVELSRAREEIAAGGQLSVALVDAHVQRTADRARALDLARAVPDRSARQALRFLGAVALVYLGAALLGRDALLRAYARVLVGDPAGSAAQADPITGDIELTYRFPAYMRREPRTLSGTGGEIRAPKGTAVTLRTRADRPVTSAELVLDLEADPSARPAAPGATPGAGAAPSGPARPAPAQEPTRPGATPPAAPPARPPPPVERRTALAVQGGRDLAGGFDVMEGGSYRFRFLDKHGKLLAEGPPIPIVLEPDAYPTARITAPERDVEVDPGATVDIAWEAEDDIGLGDVALVVKLPSGAEERRALRAGAEPVRRDGGTTALPLAALHLGEGERLTYRVEAKDTDTVSGPKLGSSETQTVRIYSEAEHRRKALERAQQAFEELVAVLGDRLDLRAQGPVHTAERLPLAQALDGRTRNLTEHLRDAAQELRKDRAGPREVAQALENVAASVRLPLEAVAADRTHIAYLHRMVAETVYENIRQRLAQDARQTAETARRDDDSLDRAMEKGILYLEQLLDKRRAEDLVKLAKSLQQKRRDLAGLMEQYRKAPTDQAKEALLAEVQRMKTQVRDLLQRMAELSKGFNDEHMNDEALAELAKSQDLMSGLDEVEKKLAAGDVEGALKALDEMASGMDRMLAGLSRTAGVPDEKAQALMRDMLAFKDQLEKLEKAQKDTAAETEQLRAEYRKRVADRLKNAEAALKRLQDLAQGARKDVEGAHGGVTLRAQPDYEVAQDALKDLERALSVRELEGANDAVRRAQPSVDRLSQVLEEDAALGGATATLTGRDPTSVEDARRRVDQAAPKVREIKDQLSRLFPDPRTVMSQDEQRKLGELAKKQRGLEDQAAALQQRLSELAQQAPLFPPSAQGQLGESRGHMGEAAAELGNRNPQRGRGEQDLALDALGRFRKGLEDAARKQGQAGGAQGFPFPFAENGGDQTGEGYEASREKVKIPGAEAHKVPEEFRRDLLEAMKQGVPERYRGDVKKYYEELVK